MKTLSLLTLIVLFSYNANAQWGKKIKGNGETKTIERTTNEYSSISIAGFFDVDLVKGNEGQLTLTGESNLLEYITTEVDNGNLKIAIKEGYNLKPSTFTETIKISVPVDVIHSLTLAGSGDIVGKTTIKTTDFKTTMSGSGDINLHVIAENIKATMSGSGDIGLKGKATNFSAVISGSGDIEAFDLDADNVNATVSGSANIEVTANKNLKARVSGSGDVHYKGNPTVDSKTAGSGDVSKA